MTNHDPSKKLASHAGIRPAGEEKKGEEKQRKEGEKKKKKGRKPPTAPMSKSPRLARQPVDFLE